MHPSRSYSTSSSVSNTSLQGYYNHPPRSDKYSITHGLADSYRDMRPYVVDVHPKLPEPHMTAMPMGIRVIAPEGLDVPDVPELELRPKYRNGQDVIYDHDVYQIVGKPRYAQTEYGDSFQYPIRRKGDHGPTITALEYDIRSIPRRYFPDGSKVRYSTDNRTYRILSAAFLPQEHSWEYRISRFSRSEDVDIRKFTLENRLTRVDSDDSTGSSHLSAPPSRQSNSGKKPASKGSFTSLYDSLFNKH